MYHAMYHSQLVLSHYPYGSQFRAGMDRYLIVTKWGLDGMTPIEQSVLMHTIIWTLNGQTHTTRTRKSAGQMYTIQAMRDIIGAGGTIVSFNGLEA